MTEREVQASDEAIAEVCARLKAEVRHVRRRFVEEKRLLEERSFDPPSPGPTVS